MSRNKRQGKSLPYDKTMVRTADATSLDCGWVPCFVPIGQSMLHPDGSGLKHGTRSFKSREPLAADSVAYGGGLLV